MHRLDGRPNDGATTSSESSSRPFFSCGSYTFNAEDVCSHSGDLGLVLAINDVPEETLNPPRTNADRYNASPAQRGNLISATAPDVYDAMTQGKQICTRGLLCPNGDVCNNTGGGVDNACHSESSACSVSGDTVSCLSAQGPAGGTCAQCIQSNGCLDPTKGGGTCEGVTGSVTFFFTLPDGRNCVNVFASGFAETQTQACLETLGNIFGSKCAASSTEIPCLCGVTDPTACTSGTVTPNGPTYDFYACDFDQMSGSAIYSMFTNVSFGAGRANTLVQCAQSFGCPCF